ncbi:MAG: NAD(P)H-hydrate dehydratase [Candidatus Levyibacteriota bacterium]
MQSFDPHELKKLSLPLGNSHKGQNGKLMVIGGSTLFHAASLWALMIASRLLDMVFYASVKENNEIVHELKKEFRNGIVVSRNDMESYLIEADAVLIGPGMMRTEKVRVENGELGVESLEEINALEDEGLQSYYLTKYLLAKYPEKKWVIDAGALQMMEPEWLKQLNGNVVITPHAAEFERVFSAVIPNLFRDPKQKDQEMLKPSKRTSFLEAAPVQNDTVGQIAKEYNCTILLKGEKDVICSPETCVEVSGGNAGMTKGGTGDVLAGLVAALACKNEVFLAACAGSYLNKQAGESLYKRVGYYFNSSDLADEIPRVMNQLLLEKK